MAVPKGVKIGSFAVLVAIAGCITITLLVFLTSTRKLPSGSMIPTWQPGARILVNRFSQSPARGAVIVFKFPENPEVDFAKRVIAKGGDKLEVEDGHPSINGWVVPSCKVGPYAYQEEFETGSAGAHHGDLFVEFLEGSAYLVFFDSAHGGQRQGPFVAKPGEYWVMGDNRNNSHDSRMWMQGRGAGVPQSMIRGTVVHDETSTPALPADMAALQPALDACMKTRPSREKSTPPSAAP